MYWLDIAPGSIERRHVGRSNPAGYLDLRWVYQSGPSADHLHMRPLIGVTTSELRPSAMATTRRHGEPAHPEMALGMTYLRTLDAAGAIPVVLPPVGTDHLGAAARPPRRHLPVRRPRSRPGGLRRARPPRRAGPDRAEPRRLRAQPRPPGAGPRAADPRHLPRRPGAQRRLRRHAAPAHPRPPPDRRRDAAPRTTSRSPPARACTGCSAPARWPVNSFHHQAVDRDRRRPARRRPRDGRHDRGDRGRRLRGRRPVARRDPARAPAAVRGPG